MNSLSTYHWIIIALVVYFAFRLFTRRGKASGAGTMICPSCGSRVDPTTRTKGSTWIELVLWLCLILPGLIYSIWRLTSRDKVCPTCSAPGLVPVQTPRGQQLLAQFASASQ